MTGQLSRSPGPERRPGPGPRRRALPRRAARVSAPALALALAAGAAHALPITVVSTDLYVRSTVISDGDRTEKEDGLVIPEGEEADAGERVGTLISTNFASQYPREPNNVPNDYVDAELNGAGDYGLGASGILFRTQLRMAEASYVRVFRNDAAESVQLSVGFLIPGMETLLGGYAPQLDMLARASAAGLYEIRDAAGDVVQAGDLFDFWLESVKVLSGAGTFEIVPRWSPDLDALLNTVGGPQLTYAEQTFAGGFDVASVTLTEFGAAGSVILQPGETVLMTMEGEARLDIGARGVEGGGQALVGDPFDLGPFSGLFSGPVFDFVIEREGAPPPLAAPLPASGWLLLAGALAALAARGARIRAP